MSLLAKVLAFLHIERSPLEKKSDFQRGQEWVEHELAEGRDEEYIEQFICDIGYPFRTDFDRGAELQLAVSKITQIIKEHNCGE